MLEHAPNAKTMELNTSSYREVYFEMNSTAKENRIDIKNEKLSVVFLLLSSSLS